MNALLLALALIYAVPLENLKGERIGEITVEDNAPDGSIFLKCRELDKHWVACLVKGKDGSEYWLYFPDDK